jgi:hypothetical protein
MWEGLEMVRQGAKYGFLAGGIGAVLIFSRMWLPPLLALWTVAVPVLSGALAGLLTVRSYSVSEPRTGVSLGAGAIAGTLIALSLFVVSVPSIVQLGIENQDTLPISWIVWVVVRAGGYLLSLTFDIIVAAGGGALAGYLMAKPEVEQ